MGRTTLSQSPRPYHLFTVGLGYSARYTVARLGDQVARVSATVRGEDKAARLTALGIHPTPFDGTAPGPGVADALSASTHLIVSAGPEEFGDPLLYHHGADIERAIGAGALRGIVYLSTIGVYGDTGGAWIDETAPCRPDRGRSQWRVRAEADWLALGARNGIPVSVLRLGGIYGPARNPFVNLEKGQARLINKPGQVFNRIHVADIAAAVEAALEQGYHGPVNVVDGDPTPPQDPIRFAAALMGVAPPVEEPYDPASMSPMARSFYEETRRCHNRVLTDVLGVTLSAPTYREGLTAMWQDGTWRGTDEDRAEASPRFRRVSKGG